MPVPTNRIYAAEFITELRHLIDEPLRPFF